jgi:hypothetical protein
VRDYAYHEYILSAELEAKAPALSEDTFASEDGPLPSLSDGGFGGGFSVFDVPLFFACDSWDLRAEIWDSYVATFVEIVPELSLLLSSSLIFDSRALILLSIADVLPVPVVLPVEYPELETDEMSIPIYV